MGGGVASAVVAANIYSSTTSEKNTYLKGLPGRKDLFFLVS